LKITNAVIAISLAAVTFACGLALTRETQPKIKVSEDSFNFGLVEQGTRLRHKFTIKNIGGNDLIIEKIEPS
jgi:hypothetical protein